MKTFIIGAILVLLGLIAAGPVAADEERKGHGPIDHVNAGTRTISVNQQIYSVPLDCDVRRASGAKVALAELRGAVRPGSPLVAMSEIDFIRFEAAKRRGGWEMVELTVLETTPE